MKNHYFTLIALVSFTCLAAVSSCSKNDNSGPFQVFDIDGNVYDTIHIGHQVWMKQNLKAIHFRDGTVITDIEDGATWTNIINTGSHTVAQCKYKSDNTNGITYGKLYN